MLFGQHRLRRYRSSRAAGVTSVDPGRMGSGCLTARMIAGFDASFPGTTMFISRFVGLLPKFETRVSAPLTAAITVLRMTRKEVEVRILNEAWLDSTLCGSFQDHKVRRIYAFIKQIDRRLHMPDDLPSTLPVNGPSRSHIIKSGDYTLTVGLCST